MQTRYLTEFVDTRVPFTGGRYRLDLSGQMISSNGEVMIPTFNNVGEALVLYDNGIRSYWMKLSVLLAIMAKRIKIPFKLWHKLDVLYVDGDCKNFHPSNTVWKFPDSGLTTLGGEFRFIPGFSRYLIDRSGIVMNSTTGRCLSPYQDQEGYWMYGVTPDVGKRTIVGMHRLLALAFIPYPADVDILDVNHLDGIKSNNDLKNLEWAKRKRNCDHAYETGLRTDNIRVIVRNAFTREERSFYSLEECGRRLKLDGETIRLRVQSKGMKVYPPGVQFKALDDETPWVDFPDPSFEIKRPGQPLTILTTNIKTGEKRSHASRGELGKYIGMKIPLLSYYLKTKGIGCVLNGYKVEYPDFEELTKSYLSERVE